MFTFLCEDKKIIFLTSYFLQTGSALYDCPHIIVVKDMYVVSVMKVAVVVVRHC